MIRQINREPKWFAWRSLFVHNGRACSVNDHHRAHAGRRWVTRRFSSRRSAWNRRLVRGRLFRRSGRSVTPVRQRRPRPRVAQIQRRRGVDARLRSGSAGARRRTGDVHPSGVCQGPRAHGPRRPDSATRPGVRVGRWRASVDDTAGGRRPGVAARLNRGDLAAPSGPSGPGGVSRRDGRGPTSPARHRPRPADPFRGDRDHRVRFRRAVRRLAAGPSYVRRGAGGAAGRRHLAGTPASLRRTRRGLRSVRPTRLLDVVVGRRVTSMADARADVGAGSVQIGAGGVSRPRRVAARRLGQSSVVARVAGPGGLDLGRARPSTRAVGHAPATGAAPGVRQPEDAASLVGEPHVDRDCDDRGRVYRGLDLAWRHLERACAPTGAAASDSGCWPGGPDVTDVTLGDVGARPGRVDTGCPGGSRHGRATRLAKLRHRLARGRVRGPGQGLRQRPAAWRGDAEAFWRAGRRPHRHARQQRDQLPGVPARANRRRPLRYSWQPGRSPGHRPGALRGSAPNLPRIL